MPTISRFFGIVIAMYFDDHGPPHFHARHAGGNAKIRIDTLEAIDSTSGVGNSASCSRRLTFTRPTGSKTGGSLAAASRAARSISSSTSLAV
jgi:hypothetical protein